MVKAFSPRRLKGFRYIESTGSENLYTIPEEMRYLQSLETTLHDSLDFRADIMSTETSLFTTTQPTQNILENLRDNSPLITAVIVFIVCGFLCYNIIYMIVRRFCT